MQTQQPQGGRMTWGDAWDMEAMWWRVARGFRTRVLATLGIIGSGIVGFIVYLVLWAGRFAWYDNLAVLLGTLLLIPLAIAAMWVSWGISLHRRWWKYARRFEM